MNIMQKFEERTSAELRLALDEVEWWNALLTRGVVSPSHAEGYIRAANHIISTKRFILGLCSG